MRPIIKGLVLCLALMAGCGSDSTPEPATETKAAVTAAAGTYVVVKGGVTLCAANPACQLYVIGTVAYGVYALRSALTDLPKLARADVVFASENQSDVDAFLDGAANAAASALNWLSGKKGAALIQINPGETMHTGSFVRTYATMALCEKARIGGRWIQPAAAGEVTNPVICSLSSCACVKL